MIFYANNDLITSFLNFLNLKKKRKEEEKINYRPMARFISSAAMFEKESFSKENEYIYICVYICLCGGAKRSWMQRTIANDYKQFACLQVLYRSSKKIPLYSIEGQIGRYEITMLWIDTNIREIWFYLHLAIFCNHYDHFLQMFGYRNTNV